MIGEASLLPSYLPLKLSPLTVSEITWVTFGDSVAIIFCDNLEGSHAMNSPNSDFVRWGTGVIALVLKLTFCLFTN